MNILVIDDEYIILKDHQRIIQQALSELYPSVSLTIDTCISAPDALCLVEKKHYDIIFSDIDMPKMKGITLCEEIENRCPLSNLFFVTSFDEYSLAAWKTFACGFLVKPLLPKDVKDACQRLRFPPQAEAARISIHCFGPFEVRCDGKLVTFARKRSLEMLAVLVDALGADISVEKIRLYLWDESEDNEEKKAYVRQLARDIRKTFSDCGVDGVLVNTVGGYRLNKELIDCDYFQWLEAGNSARPEVYMSQYDWANV